MNCWIQIQQMIGIKMNHQQMESRYSRCLRCCFAMTDESYWKLAWLVSFHDFHEQESPEVDAAFLWNNAFNLAWHLFLKMQSVFLPTYCIPIANDNSCYLIKLECCPSCVLVLWNGLGLNPPLVPENDGGGAPDCSGSAYPGFDFPGKGIYSVFPNGSKGGYLGGGLRPSGFLLLVWKK